MRPPAQDLIPNTLSADGEGRLLVKYPVPGQPDQMYRIDHGNAELLPNLPSSYYDPDGNLIEPGGSAEGSMNIAGGGILRSQRPHYFPVASY